MKKGFGKNIGKKLKKVYDDVVEEGIVTGRMMKYKFMNARLSPQQRELRDQIIEHQVEEVKKGVEPKDVTVPEGVDQKLAGYLLKGSYVELELEAAREQFLMEQKHGKKPAAKKAKKKSHAPQPASKKTDGPKQ